MKFKDSDYLITAAILAVWPRPEWEPIKLMGPSPVKIKVLQG
ncbi:hypothetical protein [Chitinibacter bivalviorum]|nr:hypothetical protein [Chitinibacter bivalviorum]